MNALSYLQNMTVGGSGGGGVTPTGSVEITENGTYDVTDKAQAVVNVPAGPSGLTWEKLFGDPGSININLTDADTEAGQRFVIPVAAFSDNAELLGPAGNYVRYYQRVTGLHVEFAKNTRLTIGTGAFSECSNLTHLYLNAPGQQIKITNDCFCRSGVTGDLNLLGVESISGSAFKNCTGITSIVTRSGTVGRDCFSGCTSLQRADFVYDYGVSIALYGFNGCTALTALILRGPTIDGNQLAGRESLLGTPIESGTGYIYVPADLVDYYKRASNWSAFADQFRALEDYTIDGTTSGALDPNKI